MAKSAAQKSVATRKAAPTKKPTAKQEPKHLWGLFDRDDDFSYGAIPFEPMTQSEALECIDEMNPDFSPYKLYRMEPAGTVAVNGVTFTPVKK